MRNDGRINARIDKALAQKVSLVRRRTNLTLSEVVKASLTRFCDQELGERRDPLAILTSAGFVGCAEGAKDLSSDYKQVLGRSLGRKA
jgi:hypothetical protein